MRTTLVLEPDVVAAVEHLRRREGLGMSEAVNRLVRAGLTSRPKPVRYEHRAEPLGLKVDVANVAEVLDLLDDEPDS